MKIRRALSLGKLERLEREAMNAMYGLDEDENNITIPKPLFNVIQDFSFDGLDEQETMEIIEEDLQIIRQAKEFMSIIRYEEGKNNLETYIENVEKLISKA